LEGPDGPQSISTRGILVSTRPELVAGWFASGSQYTERLWGSMQTRKTKLRSVYLILYLDIRLRAV
ncbi:MAG TPA: hypothetical protein PJ989_04615, partial [Oligoflexia bacterium]|nr:hypothetical protein [Oligoflexia bacterium]